MEHDRTFTSHALDNERRIWTQTFGETADERPLLIAFDGEFFRDPERMDGPATVARLVDDGRIPPLALACVSHVDIETRFRECPLHPDMPTFVADELVPWLRADAFEVPVVHDRAGTVLWGVSYTGLLVAWVALQRPEVADRLIGHSPSFWEHDNRLIAEYAARRPAAKHWWLDVGFRELETNVEHHPGVFQKQSQLAVNRAMRDQLRELGHHVRYHEFDGEHEFRCWRTTFPDALLALFAAPGSAGA